MDAKSFYEARDSRTLKLVDRTDYRNKRVLIAVDEDTARTLNGQVMVLTTSNLLSRFCRNISLICDSEVEQVYIPKKLHNRNFQSATLRLLRSIDPFGDFRIVDSDKGNYDEIIAIGTPQITKNPGFGINSDGWLSYLSKNTMVRPLERTQPNPIGASAAACIVTTEIFKSILGMDIGIKDDFCFSTFDYSFDKTDPINPVLPDSIDLKKTQMVGCGALGSAVGFFLSMLPVTETMTLIDYDQVEVSNLNRCPTFTIDDLGKMKVYALADFLSETGMKVDPFPCKYSEFVAQHGAGDPDVVLSLVDNNNSRHEIQMNMPRLILYAATGEWVFSVGRHKALHDDCHICRFPEVGQNNSECGVINMTSKGLGKVIEEFSAAVSFVSSTAALFLVSELLKINLGYSNTKNFLQLDMSLPLQTIRQHKRKRSKECICNETWFQEAYKRRIKGTQRVINLGCVPDSNGEHFV